MEAPSSSGALEARVLSIPPSPSHDIEHDEFDLYIRCRNCDRAADSAFRFELLPAPYPPRVFSEKRTKHSKPTSVGVMPCLPRLLV